MRRPAGEFNERKRGIDGVSQRILTLTSRNLERDGLARRTVTPWIPPRVHYALTDLGHSPAKPLQALGVLASPHLTQIDAAHAR